MLIDHLVYADPDLAAAVADPKERFGVRAQSGGQHIGLGTRNVCLALGTHTYLEIITPDLGQPVPAVPRPLDVDGLSRGRPGQLGACVRRHQRGYRPGP
jgi:hypothetical protein